MAKGPVDVLCIYRVKNGTDGEFRKLLEKHGQPEGRRARG